jgi:hypothetical protein
MPQPFRHLSGDLIEDPNVLLQRPNLAVLIALIAAKWTRIETQLAFMFGYMLKSEEGSALAIYHTLIDRSLREAAFQAVAKNKLPLELQKRISGLFARLRPLATKRNVVVHGTWSIVTTRSASLMLIDISDVNKHFHQVRSTVESPKNRPEPPTFKLTEYMERDFHDICRSIEELERDIMSASSEILKHALSSIEYQPRL